ncbi:MAG: thioester reductase domain-containing protein [Thiomargarita sp.]|nr:thioester reductase domain-containing protein [Thiomargarita sp.]
MLKTPDDKLDLKTEAVLEPTIQFHNPLSKNLVEPKSIFLTGATGFLGAYLLDELLHKITANIYCLVRCNHVDEGKQRLKSHLQFYSLWNEVFSSRIIPVVGDLSKPHFGLSEAQFSELASQIDIIYHNGAQISYIRPYSALKTINVLGTIEILRLAGLIQTKPVHFISTLAVFLGKTYATTDQILETDVPEFTPNMKGGYKQSKLVAEKLVMAAQERGLPINIYRPVRIMGDANTGVIGNLSDSLCSIIKGCIQIGKFPTLDIPITLVPVDYVSQAVIYLSRQEKLLGKAFNLFNPHLISWQTLFNKVSSLGYSLEEVSYDDWLTELKHKASQQPEDKLYPFLLLFLRSPNNLMAKKPLFDAHRTFEELANASIVCPRVDTELLPTYFLYFQKSGYIESHLSKG